MSDVSDPANTNGVWPLLQLVSVAQTKQTVDHVCYNVLSIDLPTECLA